MIMNNEDVNIISNETLIYQLKADLQELFKNSEYNDTIVKDKFEFYPEPSYPMVVVSELENSDNSKYYDLKEHIVNVGYQLTIFCDETFDKTAIENVQSIIELIKQYMRGERYHALKRTGGTPITKKSEDENIMVGYMRYTGCIDIDNHIIYRRS